MHSSPPSAQRFARRSVILRCERSEPQDHGGRLRRHKRKGGKRCCRPVWLLCRTPAGHPEGFIEAFANLYRMFASDVRAAGSGFEVAPSSPAPVTVALRGMSFIDAMVRSSSAGQHWVAL